MILSKSNDSMKNTPKYENFGITTGSLSTATALAALKSLLLKHDNKKAVKSINSIKSILISSPYGEIDIEISEINILDKKTAIASGFKYPYNDPDITVNHEIMAKVQIIDYDEKINGGKQERVIVTGGKGVGTVTKKGLQIPVGQSAINPVPLQMIKKNLSKILSENKIAKVEIIVPDGEEIAKKTMNPRLGIVGGISILGTTGIAKSFHEESWKKSLICQLDIADAGNFENLVFVPGNIGEKYALENLNIKKEQIIKMGNFVGFMLEEAKKRGIKKLILFGHVGKLVKIAGSIFNTANKIADGRKEIITCHASLLGAKTKTLKKLFKSKTTEDMLNILKEENIKNEVLNSISKEIIIIIKNKYQIEVELILINMKGKKIN
ncbi:cobalt-precorrin-6A synthase [Methanobrevibacter curvatus]|uniref:Cobalt-precorrin-5B C(1)-methyltransferase n=2 Tax=Methanobrevibacter curvatus TaxID=49547 RepID=A0A162FE80_9EURY|nr:cobalt-precorrin-6A synthase [Methanobrevibacter curvatus]